MALHSLTNDGNMAWSCPGCGCDGTAHISHAEVQFSGEQHVALPRCDCGKQTFLRTQFTDQELAVMYDKNGNPDASYVTAQRHIALHQQLQQAGKQYTPPPVVEPIDTGAYAGGNMYPLSAPAEEVILKILQQYGIIPNSQPEPQAVSVPTPQIQPPQEVQSTDNEATNPQMPIVNLLSIEE